jgi:hypothetical protein
MRLGAFVGKGFQKLIQQEKATILQKWFVLAIQAYDPDTAKFLQNQKDQFANPVGNNTLKGLQGLLDQLLDDLDPKTVISFLGSEPFRPLPPLKPPHSYFP